MKQTIEIVIFAAFALLFCFAIWQAIKADRQCDEAAKRYFKAVDDFNRALIEAIKNNERNTANRI